MSHHISGIITSFRYLGELASTPLIGNYFFIPLQTVSENFKAHPVSPFSELNSKILVALKDLSFRGKVAWIETDFFVEGTQLAVVFENGRRTLGPLKSFHGIVPEEDPLYTISGEAINEALKQIGIIAAENKDEFDTVGLGRWRSNKEVYNG